MLKRFKILLHRKGFTLLEVLVALSILAILSAFATRSFTSYIKANYTAQQNFEGVQAAQNIIDELRYADIAAMPTSGTDAKRTVTVDSGRTYDVYVSYCTNENYCTSEAVRHLSISVRRNGSTVYNTETVFTALDTTQTTSSTSSSRSSSSVASSSSSSRSSSSSSSSSAAVSSSSSSHSSSSSSSSSSRSSSSSSSSRRCRRSWCDD